jgi:hypothetical protein
MLTLAEEGADIAEIAFMGTASGNYQRIRHQIKMALDEVTADGRRSQKTASLRLIERCRTSLSKIFEKLRPDVFTGAHKNRVTVWRRLVR